MAKAMPAAVSAAEKYPDFTLEEMASAAQIAKKLALLTRESLLFIDGFATGAIMAQKKEE